MAINNLKTNFQKTYTYDDFTNEANRLGLMGQFSDADLRLAQANPDAGMSILSYKNDYRNAKTDEARVLANAGAESVRSSYGGYTGSGDGGSFRLDPLSPGSFSYQDAPSYTNNYAGDIAKLWKQQQNVGQYSYGGAAPTYQNRYDDRVQELLNTLLNREDFRYDASTDPLYAQYKQQYKMEGKRAMHEALGTAAGMSGGRVSSNAMMAAQEAGNYYAGQTANKIPELYQLAYQKYLNDYQLKQSDLAAVQGAEQNDYAKFLNDRQQFNTDRSFDFQTWQDAQNRAKDNLQTAIGLEQLDWDKYKTGLGQYNTDRNFNYAQLLDEVSNQTQLRQEEAQREQRTRELEQQLWQNQYNLANLGGSYGDYSGLNELGITPDVENLRRLAIANAGRTTPVGSGGSGGDATLEDTTGDATLDADTAAADALKRADAAKGQVQSQEDWNALVGEYGEAALLQSGYKKPTGDGTTPVDTTGNGDAPSSPLRESGTPSAAANEPTIDMASVLALNRGPLNEARLNALVASGEIEEYVEGGKIKFRNTGKKATLTFPDINFSSFLPTPTK